MVDNLSEMMQREWNLVNSDANDHNGNSNINHTWHSRPLSRKISDHNGNNTMQHPQTRNDFNDIPPRSSLRTPKPLSNRWSLETAYDTDGAIGLSRQSSKHHHNSSNNYEYLVSPRLPVRRHMTQTPKPTSTIPGQHRVLQKVQLTNTSSPLPIYNEDDRDEDSNYDNDARRRHIRLSRRAHQSATGTSNHATRVNHSAALVQRNGPLAASPTLKSLRIIFMRHSERANQALGPDWFNKAFRTNTYKPYDINLPDYLPKRRSDQAYEYDAPLTVRGLKIARLTGRAMMNSGLVADVCLSSTALRCVQTCERILTGMDRRDRIPIRIEPGLFECPHLNHKITDSFMTKKEFMENRYNIKHEYKALIPRVHVPETLDDYFDRSVAVMRGIINRYGHHGGTVLIVTHAPGLLALTDAIKGLRPNVDTFYRTVSTYSPLATCIAEYDGSKWKYTERPFNFIPTDQ
ncbi:unnamed protein product [Adineta steineri]|uniref:Uncharacterized protein n=1 Tax=Adineta steineri TaxID=433720 RepID=A0A813RWW9_9BILA|nr:unnamed protein product [Adineta steineri]CAF0813948.1 unnamed protein product [Adineta steineri]CAF3672404.1 unnamed protein product [Adineta steineri]